MIFPTSRLAAAVVVGSGLANAAYSIGSVGMRILLAPRRMIAFSDAASSLCDAVGLTTCRR